MIKNRIRETKKKKFFRGILRIIEFIVICVVIYISAIIVVQRFSNNEKGLFGYRMFKVETGSMIPKYLINDVILVKEMDTNNIQIGDDVTYKAETGQMKGMIVTHQVIEKGEKEGRQYFYTKGIANDTKDPIIYEDQIIGVVEKKIYTLSFIINLISILFSNIYSLYFCIVIPLTIYIFFKVVHSTDRRERKIIQKIEKTKHEIAKENELKEKKRKMSK